jgi:hypothetical protein
MYDSESARFWGKQKPPVYLQLFGHAEPGWIDLVQDHHYPELRVLHDHLAASSAATGRYDETPFELARSLDDFGYRKWHNGQYSDKYSDLTAQWVGDDSSVRAEQDDIITRLSPQFPSEPGNYLYFLISRGSGVDRVVYVGKADGPKGMRDRFLRNDHAGYRGDCRSTTTNGSDKTLFRRIRLKSAELRRRGVERVNWTELTESVSKTEKALRWYKLACIEEAVGVKLARDPVNSR